MSLKFEFERAGRSEVSARVVVYNETDERKVLIKAFTVNPTKDKTIDVVINTLIDRGYQVDSRDDLLQWIAGEALSVLRKVADTSQEPAEVKPLDKMSNEIRAAAVEMLRDPALLEIILMDAAAIGIAGEELAVLLLYLAATSRLLPEPLSVSMQGASSGGKSYLLRMVASFIPPEGKLMAHGFSPNALIYLPPGRLEHRVVFAGEKRRTESESDETVKQWMRELLSDGQITKIVTVKAGDGLATKEFHQKGPIALLDSTTRADLFQEDRNRVVWLHPTETQEQTRKVMETIGQRYLNTGDDSSGETGDPIRLRHWALQRTLTQRPITIPYAPLLMERLNAGNLEMRRAAGMFLSAIAASALLFQFQRKVDGIGRTIANEIDFQTAATLLVDWIEEAIGGAITAGNESFLDLIRQHFPQDSFTVAEFHARTLESKGRVEYQLAKLVDAGHVKVSDDRRGRSGKRYRLNSVTEKQVSVGLPDIDEIEEFMLEMKQ